MTSRTLSRPSSSRRRTAAAACVVALLALTACSGGSNDAMSGDGADMGSAAEMPAEDKDLAMRDGLVGEADTVADRDAPEMEKAIISTGNVALHDKDVEQAAFDVQQVVDEYGGEVTEQKTSTDDEGDVRNARMVVRVPAEKFHEAFADLEAVADLSSSSHSSEDVTTQVIDNQVRIRAQRRSIQRIEVLLDRAQSIRDIMSIESQLTRRQADLDSLERRQAYLQDETSMSTITVSIERTPDKEQVEEEGDDSGFLAGLSDGWGALKTFGTALATLAGNLLPFAVVGLVIGVPVWLLVRGLRRRPKAASS